MASDFRGTKLDGSVSSSRRVGAPQPVEIRPESYLSIAARFICFPAWLYNPWCAHTRVRLVRAAAIPSRKGN